MAGSCVTDELPARRNTQVSPKLYFDAGVGVGQDGVSPWASFIPFPVSDEVSDCGKNSKLEAHFRVTWPQPIPSHLRLCSKITIKCPACGELAEPYAFFLDKILQAPNLEIPTVQPESISPRDLNPDPDARRTCFSD